LSGLPVVSTRSRGGRDVFFDPEYVAIVPEDPKAVADGVRKLIAKNISPARIRHATLEKMRPHRKRFFSLLQGIYDRENFAFDVLRNWGQIYTDKMIQYARRWPADFLNDAAAAEATASA